VTAVAHVPGGAHPSYAEGYSVRDNDFYREWDAISRDRERFTDWLALIREQPAAVPTGSRS
jgi:glutaconate CoA-transferase subunit A